MTKDLTRDDVRAMAADIGLARLSETHADELLRATQAARRRRGSLKIDKLAPADEPAHVFRLGAEGVR